MLGVVAQMLNSKARYQYISLSHFRLLWRSERIHLQDTRKYADPGQRFLDVETLVLDPV